MAPIFGYWKIRGLGQPIRYLLEYSGAEYVSKNYEVEAEWHGKDKPNFNHPFPNLPYYIDESEGVKLVQSGAIIRYLARKHNLVGVTEEQKQRVDLAECQLEDLRNAFCRLCYTDKADFEKAKVAYIEGLGAKLNQWSQFLGDKKWFLGDKLTYVDFLIYEVFDEHKVFIPGCLDKFANLQKFQERFEALEKIKKYRASKDFIDKPFNWIYATWDIK